MWSKVHLKKIATIQETFDDQGVVKRGSCTEIRRSDRLQIKTRRDTTTKSRDKYQSPATKINSSNKQITSTKRAKPEFTSSKFRSSNTGSYKRYMDSESKKKANNLLAKLRTQKPIKIKINLLKEKREIEKQQMKEQGFPFLGEKGPKALPTYSNRHNFIKQQEKVSNKIKEIHDLNTSIATKRKRVFEDRKGPLKNYYSFTNRKQKSLRDNHIRAKTLKASVTSSKSSLLGAIKKNLPKILENRRSLNTNSSQKCMKDGKMFINLLPKQDFSDLHSRYKIMNCESMNELKYEFKREFDRQYNSEHLQNHQSEFGRNTEKQIIMSPEFDKKTTNRGIETYQKVTRRGLSKITPVKQIDIQNIKAGSESLLNCEETKDDSPVLVRNKYFTVSFKEPGLDIEKYLARTPSESERLPDSDMEECESSQISQLLSEDIDEPKFISNLEEYDLKNYQAKRNI
ncbi:unnamed protein product [Moneuplotes crassus]|uniref:Uncharacterized protein n=1 Tax=Euplotes crassus TaxID=5936 RepID=A0AAD1X431_EUPCR|nr:unnamed protein product [Moneuplotes crassus]